jgi:hypothetical protein
MGSRFYAFRIMPTVICLIPFCSLYIASPYEELFKGLRGGRRSPLKKSLKSGIKQKIVIFSVSYP